MENDNFSRAKQRFRNGHGCFNGRSPQRQVSLRRKSCILQWSPSTPASQPWKAGISGWSMWIIYVDIMGRFSEIFIDIPLWCSPCYQTWLAGKSLNWMEVLVGILSRNSGCSITGISWNWIQQTIRSLKFVWRYAYSYNNSSAKMRWKEVPEGYMQ